MLLREDRGLHDVGGKVVELVRVRLIGENGGLVVVLKRELDGVDVVEKIEHRAVVLLWMRPVQPRQGLHGLHTRENLVDVHGVQQWLVVSGLKFVGADQYPIGVFLNAILNQ